MTSLLRMATVTALGHDRLGRSVHGQQALHIEVRHETVEMALHHSSGYTQQPVYFSALPIQTQQSFNIPPGINSDTTG